MVNLDEAFVPLHDDELASQPSQHRNADAWTPIAPVPGDAPEPTKALAQRFAPAGYKFSDGYRYHDASGQLLGCVVRFDRPANGVPADKQVLPLSFCAGPNGGGTAFWRAPARRSAARRSHCTQGATDRRRRRGQS